MTSKLDPIIAVNDVELSSAWYQSVFGCKSLHGGKEFDILVDESKEVLICLHKWGEHGHPTMADKNITVGNGLILYLRTKAIRTIRENVEKSGTRIEEDIHLNTNSNRMEFSLRDPDGYFLIVSDYHIYEG